MSDARRSRRATTTGWAVLLVAVGLAAWALRFRLLYRNGLLNLGTYDDGVHFAAAVNLVHGRLPYRDVLFLQPPGVVLAASPFAALAGVLGDPRAFILAKCAFTVVGGGNAVLVAVVLRRFGPAAAATGGFLYALTFPAVYDERTVTLEPIATAGLLGALALLPAARTRRSGRLLLLAGALAGVAVGFKIWYVVPFAVLLAVAAGGGRLRFLIGGAVAGGAIYLPFFLLAPGRMWQQVVLAQIGRPEDVAVPVDVRLRSMIGVSGTQGRTALGGWDPGLLTVLLVAAAVLLAAIAALDRRSRVFVVLLGTGAAILLLSPSYFQHYAILTTAPLCLVAGAATAAVLGRIPRVPVRAVAVVALVAAMVPLNAVQLNGVVGRRPPLAGLQQAAQRVHGCIVSDDPGLLAGMDVLTRQVEEGCDVQADPSGISYTVHRRVVDGVAVDRDRNPAFQRAIVAYLRSGSAYLFTRQRRLLLTPANLAVLRADPVRYQRDGFRLREPR